MADWEAEAPKMGQIYRNAFLTNSIKSIRLAARTSKLPEVIWPSTPRSAPCCLEALKHTCKNMRKVVAKAKLGTGTTVHVVVAGDFNCHDQLWGGDDVSSVTQGEADTINYSLR